MNQQINNIVNSMIEDYSFIFDEMDAEVFTMNNYNSVYRYIEPYLQQITVDTIADLPEDIQGDVYEAFVDFVVESILSS